MCLFLHVTKIEKIMELMLELPRNEMFAFSGFHCQFI